MKYSALTESDISFLKSVVGEERMSMGQSYLELHSVDETRYRGFLPDVVVWPRTTQEVSRILDGQEIEESFERNIRVVQPGRVEIVLNLDQASAGRTLGCVGVRERSPAAMTAVDQGTLCRWPVSISPHGLPSSGP